MAAEPIEYMKFRKVIERSREDGNSSRIYVQYSIMQFRRNMLGMVVETGWSGWRDFENPPVVIEVLEGETPT